MKLRLFRRSQPPRDKPAATRRVRVGLAIGSDAIRAVAVRRGVVQWALEAPRDGETNLAAQILALLRPMAGGYAKWPRPRVVAAIGPAHVCAKRLSGFPPVSDRAIAAQLLHEGVSRFFLGGTVPVITTIGAVTSEETWAAAFEQPVVDAVFEACDSARLPIQAIVPAASVLGGSLEEDTLTWRDGNICVRLRFEQRMLAEIHRGSGGATGEAGVRLVAPLLALGEDSIRFADAYGAAVSRHASWSLAAPRAHVGSVEASRPRTRGHVALGLCAIALIAALLAPAMSANVTAHRARTEMASIARQHAEALRAEADLAQVTAALAEVSRLTEGHRSMLELLAQLTAVLPDRSAIATLRVDSARATIVLLTPRATEVVGQLDTVGLFITPEIVGPVTREVVDGKDLERVTVRFLVASNGPGTTVTESAVSTPHGAETAFSAGRAHRTARQLP